mgnify:CR=1 FL=1
MSPRTLASTVAAGLTAAGVTTNSTAFYQFFALAQAVELARDRILDYFRADPAEYGVIFTANASHALKLVGENQIVYASDYPHWDNSYPGSLDEIRDRGDLSPTQKAKILGDNARRLYGIK